MKKILLAFLLFPVLVFAQTKTVPRPKVVIGIVVDQMRWDYIYKFYEQYGENGFKKLLKNGFVCQNTMVNYLPSHTAPGHSSIYTGSVPSITGITGNAFIDNKDGLLHDASEDKSVNLIGGSKKGSSSPVNMLTTTMTDELRMATNFKSRVFSIALKDRGSVFPGGHLANASYWYKSKIGFTTSTYYMEKLPDWLVKFNDKHLNDSLLKYGWNLSGKDYSLSLSDDNEYEECFPKEKAPIFPHATGDRDMGQGFEMTPQANTYTISMARACIENEKIGMTGNTDFLAISFSSPDILGHQFGPNSVEMQDMFINLDRDIAGFISYLDKTYGVGNYLLFLTADHGGSHNEEYLKDIKVPAGVFSKKTVLELNDYLKSKFGKDSIVIGFTNYYQFFLNNPLLDSNTLTIPRSLVRKAIIDWLNNKQEVLYAIDLYDISNANLPTRIKDMVMNGYNRRRGGDVQVILNTGWYEYAGKTKGNTHGTWSPVDTHIPLIFYGWNIKPGETYVEHYTTDIAPTISSLLHIQMPNGCIGKTVIFK